MIPARLHGHRDPSGGRVECLLLGPGDGDRFEALVHPGQKLRPGTRMRFEGAGVVLHGEVLDRFTFGRRTVRLWRDDGGDLESAIEAIGEIPLPPYIKRPVTASDRERYQTVYARERGSVAAPTAGLHLTPATLDALAARGIGRAEITLHVGYGTFEPVRTETVEDHRIHAEPFSIDATRVRVPSRAHGVPAGASSRSGPRRRERSRPWRRITAARCPPAAGTPTSSSTRGSRSRSSARC